MKKVKTFILSFIFIMASAFVTGCNCSKGDQPVAPGVAEKNIMLETTSQTWEGNKPTVDSETGIMKIYCNEGDKFTIQYTLTPENTTNTQVSWTITDESVVTPERMESQNGVYYYSRSIKEKVTFKTGRKGKSKITFKTQTGKEAIVDVDVAAAIKDLPRFAPYNPTSNNDFKFNPNTHTLSWVKPTKCVMDGQMGNVIDVDDRIMMGLTGYHLVIKNLDTGVDILDKKLGPEINSWSNMKPGINYQIEITILGDDRSVKTSAKSLPFYMYQLENVKNFKHVNGTLSFDTPKITKSVEIKYTDNDFSSVTVGSEQTYTTDYKDVIGASELDEFNFSVKAFPKEYNVSKGFSYFKNELFNGEMFYFYPSAKSETLNVVKLHSPSLTKVTKNTSLLGQTTDVGFDYDKSLIQMQSNMKESKFTGRNVQYKVEILNFENIRTLEETITNEFVEVFDRGDGTFDNEFYYYDVVSKNLKVNYNATVKVYAIGDEKTTISSEDDISEYKVHVTGLDMGSAFTISDNVVGIPNVSLYNVGGFDIFFKKGNSVEKYHFNKNEFLNNSAFLDLTKKVSEIENGVYEVYGIYKGEITDIDNEGLSDNYPANFDSQIYKMFVGDQKIYTPGKMPEMFLQSNGDFAFNAVTIKGAIDTSIVYELNVGQFVKTILPESEVETEVFDNVNKFVLCPKNLNIENIKGCYPDTGFEFIQYSIIDGSVKFNLIDILKSKLGDVDYENYINKEGVEFLAYNMKARVYRNEFSGIDTQFSSYAKFARVALPQSTPTLNNYKLNFAGIDNVAGFVLSIDKNNSKFITQNSNNNIDLKSVKLKDDSKKSLYDCVLKGNEKTKIDFQFVGISSNSNGIAYLDNYNSYEYYHSANLQNIQPTFEGLGVLKWSTTSKITDNGLIVDANKKYSITISLGDGTLVTNKIVAPTLDEVTEGLCKIIPGDGLEINDKFELDISNDLRSFKDNDTNLNKMFLDFKVNIEEIDSTAFDGVVSKDSYARIYKHLKVNREDGTSSALNKITWENLDNNITYVVKIGELETKEITKNEIFVSELGISTEGNYLITVTAKQTPDSSIKSMSTKSSLGVLENPLLVFGNNDSCNVICVSQTITIGVDTDNNLYWKNVIVDETHSANYVLSYDSNNGLKTVKIENQKDLDVKYKAKDLLDVKVGADFNMTVVPELSFKDFGYLVCGKEKQNNIYKCKAPSGETTENSLSFKTVEGELVAYVFDKGGESADVGEIILFDESGNLISTNDYSVRLFEEPAGPTIKAQTAYKKYIITLKTINEGQLKYKLVVKQNNCIYSEPVLVALNKVNAVNDFKRITVDGNSYFEWKVVENVTTYSIDYYKLGTLPSEPVLPPESEGGETVANALASDVIVDNLLNIKIYVKYDSLNSSYKCFDSSDAIEESKNCFYDVESSSFRYKFDESIFITGGCGEYLFRVKTLTNINSYINGSYSSESVKIVKLRDSYSVEAVDGKLKVNGYTPYGDIDVVNNVLVGIKVNIGTEELPKYLEYSKEFSYSNENVSTSNYGMISTKAVTQNPIIIDFNTLDFSTLKGLSLSEPEKQNEINKFINANSYELSFKYLGNGKELLDSNVYNAIVSRLPVSNVSTKEGVISWTCGEGVTGYNVKISDGVNEDVLIKVPLDGAITGDEILLDDNRLNGFKFNSNLKYKVSIQAFDSASESTPAPEIPPEPPVESANFNAFAEGDVKVDTLTGKLFSIWSEKMTVIKLVAPAEVYLTNNAQEDPTVRWVNPDGKSVENPDGTIIKDRLIYGNLNEIGVNNIVLKYNPDELNTYSIQIPSIYNSCQVVNDSCPVGLYALSMYYVGTTNSDINKIGYLSSDSSNEVAVDYVTETQEIKIINGNIEWSAVDGATGYYVQIQYSDNSLYKKFTTKTFIKIVDIKEIYDAKNITILASTKTQKITESGNHYKKITLVTKNEDAIKTFTNTITTFGSNGVKDFKVKDGMLNWSIDLSEIDKFVKAEVKDGVSCLENPYLATPEPDVPPAEVSSFKALPSISKDDAIKDIRVAIVRYIIERINLGKSLMSPDQDFKGTILENLAKTPFEQLTSHFYEVAISFNKYLIKDIADSVYLTTADGTRLDTLEKVIADIVSNLQITSNPLKDRIDAMCAVGSGYRLEFVYDVSINPTRENAENPEVNAKAIEDTIEYKEGLYSMDIYTLGTTDKETPFDIPVLNSKFYSLKSDGSILNAYKPVSPDRIVEDLNGEPVDIIKYKDKIEDKNAEIRFVLVNDGYKPSEQDPKNNLYLDYIIRIQNSNDSNDYGLIDIHVDKGLIINNNCYSVKLKDIVYSLDDTSLDSLDKMNKFGINGDTLYDVYISTKGTEDSSSVVEGRIYLNSNKNLYNEKVAILNLVTDDNNLVTVKQNKLNWTPNNNSSKSKLYIYGPINNNNHGVHIDEWYHEGMDLSMVSCTIKEFEQTFDTKISSYSLFSDEIDSFASGGYVFRLQELGNGKGIVDGKISDNFPVEKLKPVTNIRLEAGRFIWDKVDFADSYKINLYKSKDGEPDVLINYGYTKKCEYFLPDGSEYNEDGYLYYIEVIANKMTGIETGNKLKLYNLPTDDDVCVEYLQDNWFSSDSSISSKHARLSIPYGLTVNKNGVLYWDKVEGAANYEIKFNEDSMNTIKTPTNIHSGNEITNGFGFDGVQGLVPFNVRSLVASTDTTMINSSYSESVNVYKLSNPDIKVIEDSISQEVKENLILMYGENYLDFVGNISWLTRYTDTIIGTNTYQDGLNQKYYSEITLNNSIVVKNGMITFENLESVSPDGYNVDSKTLILKYFTDLMSRPEGFDYSKYTSDSDLVKYPEGDLQVDARFVGETENSNLSNFYLASQTITLNAKKLASPVVSMSIVNAENPVNRLKWNVIENAKDYNLFIATKNAEGIYDKQFIGLISSKAGYTTDSEYCYYVIDEYLSDASKVYYFYVQAVGGTNAEINYINSSYSTPKEIALPVTPSNVNFKDGVMSWTVDSETAYHVGIELTYEILETEKHYLAVKDSAGKNLNKYNIDSRSVESLSRDNNLGGRTNYIKVKDFILLDILSVGGENKTQLEYKLTNIGNYTGYKIFTYLMDVDDAQLITGSYKSEDLLSEETFEYAFNMYDSGDGSKTLPYVINNSTELNNIRIFPDRNFVIGKDIDYINEEWFAIEKPFTGSIDARKDEFTNYKLTFNSGYKFIASDDSHIYFAFIKENMGSISNIDIDINIDTTSGGVNNHLDYSGCEVSGAGLVKENKGTIDNININGSITAKVYCSSLFIGGIVYRNSKATIKNSTSNLEIYAENTKYNADTSEDINTIISGVGGVVCFTRDGSVVDNCKYIGKGLTANRVGGIIYSANNTIISNCTVGSDVLKTSLTGLSYKKSAYVGGLICIYNQSKPISQDNIYKCNVYADLVFDYKTNESNSLVIGSISMFGGLIGSYIEGSNISTIIDTNVNIIMRAKTDSAIPANITPNELAAYAFISNGSYTCTNCTYKIVVNDKLPVQRIEIDSLTEL